MSKHHLPVIYHGCGNVGLIFEDFIEIGLDAYNPLEVKANMDAVNLKTLPRSNRLLRNTNIQVWETGDLELIRREILKN